MHPSEALSPRDAFGPRVVAYILDLLLIFASIGVLGGTAGLIFAGAVSLLCLGVLEGLTGYSFARALLGAKTVKAGTTDAPGIVRGVVRWLLAPVGIPILTTISAMFNDRRRGIGDLAAGTEVLGLAPTAQWRVRAVFAWLGLIQLFVAIWSFDTFLILNAIYLPMVIAGLVLVFGARRMEASVLWLVGFGLALVPAALMSFISLCHRGGGRCVDVSESHKAIVALVACGIAIIVLFTLRGPVMRYTVMALTAFVEVWMFLRLRNVDDMAFAAYLLIGLLVLQVVFEVGRVRRQRLDEVLAAIPRPDAAAT